jgi:hypothetical protein
MALVMRGEFSTGDMGIIAPAVTRQPKARIEAATFSTADGGITLALFGYGLTRPIGHHSMANAGVSGLICVGRVIGLGG